MWLKCKCGEKIHDISDNCRDKARFFPDEQWFQISENNLSPEVPWSELSNHRIMLQCMDCFRIYIENKKGEFICFKPEDDISFGFLGKK